MKNALVLFLCLVPSLSLQGASIWKSAQADKKLDLFASEERVWKRHDLVSVFITEKTTAMHDDETDVKKDNSFASKISAWFKWDFGGDKPVQAKTLPEIGYTSNKAFKTEASVEKDSFFQGQITAEILEVMPNGNLVLTAKKEINIGKDRHFIRFTGVIMPRDIDANNQVLSSKVADAKIEFGGSGPVSESQKEGLLARLLNKMWVF